jgi:ankyrin repeat protein
MALKYFGRWLIVPVLVLATASAAAAAAATPVIDAVKSGDHAALRALLQKRADVNVAAPDGTSPLHLAIQKDDIQATELLLAAGANVKAANRFGITPLLVACINGNAAIVEKLLKAGADPNSASPEGETALMTAARTGKTEALKLLLAHGATVNLKESWRGQTALMWAAAENHPEAVKLLVEAGADVHARSNGGFTPLLFAVRAGRSDAVRALLSSGANANDAIQPSSGAKPAPAGRAPAAAGAGARPGAPEPPTLAQVFNTGNRSRGGGAAGMSALVLAILNAHFELAAELVERGADANSDAHGWTALHQLAWTRRPPIQHGLPPAVRTGNMDSLELAKRLLQRGANPNARMTREPADGARNILNRLGSTPFLQAAKLADVPLMRVLLEHGANPSITTDEGATPLMAAAGVGIWQLGENAGTNEEAFEAVKLCVELGNDVNAVDANGNTALHGAAHRGANEMVKFLVEKGAKLNAVNKLGWTPWIIADGVFYPNTYNRRLDTAALLVELGADPKAGKRRPEDLPPSEAGALVSRP